MSKKILKGQFGLPSINNNLGSNSLGEGLAGSLEKLASNPIKISEDSYTKFNDNYNTWRDNQYKIGQNNAKLGGFSLSNLTNYSPQISATLDISSNLFGLKPDEDSGYKYEQAISNGLIQSGNPIAMAIGLGAKASSMGAQALNVNANTMSKEQADLANINGFQRGLNNVVGSLNNMAGPFGWLVNSAFGKTNDVYKSDSVDKLRGAYTDSANFIDTASTMGGKNYLTGNRTVNKSTAKSNSFNSKIEDIDFGQRDIISSVPNTTQRLLNQNFNTYNNTYSNGMQSLLAKNGTKLLSREELDKILSFKKQEITKLQNGGSILIPEGALHKNKHHMEDVNPELAEDLTKKGIPVVVTDSEGNVSQCAEVEKEELTLSRSLTEQIEDLWKDGSEEAMIEAGKLFVDALFNDCTDNANLIERVE